MRENNFDGSWESWNDSRRISLFVVFCDNLTLNSLFLSSSHHHQLDSWWNIPFLHSSFSSHSFSIFLFLHLRKETMKRILWYRNGNQVEKTEKCVFVYSKRHFKRKPRTKRMIWNPFANCMVCQTFVFSNIIHNCAGHQHCWCHGLVPNFRKIFTKHHSSSGQETKKETFDGQGNELMVDVWLLFHPSL